jgi:GTP-binding protein Era
MPDPVEPHEVPPVSPADEAAVEAALQEAILAAGATDGDGLFVRARESLEQTIKGLKLSPEEEQALAGEIGQLRDLAVKLDEGSVEIAAFGMVSRGKSSVLNALLGRDVFRAGATHGTTVGRGTERWEGATSADHTFHGSKLILVDTPGIDEVGGEAREKAARDVARHADLILFVVSGDMQRVEFEALATLREAKKPIILVFNQIDRYPDADRDAIYAKIKNERVRALVRPDDVVMTAARPDPIKVVTRLSNGTKTVEWERPAPDVEGLRRRILDVLEREGKALVALNTLLFAGDLHEEILAHKLRIRDEAANRLIWNYSIAKGVAVGLNPIPVADMAGGLAVDVAMIIGLSRLYGIALTSQTARSLVFDMIRAQGALGAVEVLTRLAGWGIKASLGGATAATGGMALPLAALGYTALGLTLGSTAASTSYFLGHGAKVYLKQGCQWGPAGIKTVIHEILREAREDSIVERLRDELKRTIGEKIRGIRGKPPTS